MGPAWTRRTSLHGLRQKDRRDGLGKRSRWPAIRHDLRAADHRQRERHALLIQGASDGVVHAIKPQTGEPVWKYEISKRGLNTGVVLHGTTAILTHSEENLDSSEMGMMVAVDATSKGEIKKEQVKWTVYGWQGGFSSPVIDGDRLYQIDNGANIAAFDVNSGKQLWLQNLGTIQKASPVLADGKLYVGTENGKFFILKPSATGAEIPRSGSVRN